MIRDPPVTTIQPTRETPPCLPIKSYGHERTKGAGESGLAKKFSSKGEKRERLEGLASVSIKKQKRRTKVSSFCLDSLRRKFGQTKCKKGEREC